MTKDDPAAASEPEKDEDDAQGELRFPPEEEANLVAESNSHKTEANELFSSGKYNAAIAKYDEALAVCPVYLDYELAVLKSNIAACHLKLEEWKEAISNATAALEGLTRVEKEASQPEADAGKEKAAKREVDDDEDVEEVVISEGASRAGPALSKVEDNTEQDKRQKRLEDIARIRAKALMRRARARSELGGWSVLEGALEDYKTLDGMPNLAPADRKIVQSQLRSLPPRVKSAQETETAEMWSKLKELGNGILKPFGLSTDSFQMTKDEKTGGYSMNFAGGANK